MKEIIIRTSEPFKNSTSYRYDDEDLSTLGATEVFESIVLRNNEVMSWCRLMGNDAVKHIDSHVIIKHEVIIPGTQQMSFRAATTDEIKETIVILKKSPSWLKSGTVSPSELIAGVERQLITDERNKTLNEILK
jgi:hypothetical protein